jgi:transposase
MTDPIVFHPAAQNRVDLRNHSLSGPADMLSEVLRKLFKRRGPLLRLGAYTGTPIDWAKQIFGYTVEVVKRTGQHLFKVLPKRWIVERTFAWLNWSPRLSKDYELRHTSADSTVYIAFAHLLLRRST